MDAYEMRNSLIVTVLLMTTFLVVSALLPADEPVAVSPAKSIRVGEHMGEPYVEYEQGNVRWRIKLKSVHAIYIGDDRVIWYVGSAQLRVDISMDEFDRAWQLYEQQKEDQP